MDNRPPVVMSLADAAFNTAHDYPHGGAEALGQRMGKRNLSAEVNPKVPGAKLGLLDARKMQTLAGDFRILYAMAQECGHFPPVPMPPDLSDAASPCMATLAELAKEFSELLGEVSSALLDHEVTDNELARALREWGELVVRGQVLMQQLTGMNEALRVRRGLKPKET